MLLSLIRTALAYLEGVATSNPELASHLASQVRGPTYGSFIVGLDTWEATRATLLSLDWEEVARDDLPAGTTLSCCRYLRATMPESVEAYENIATYIEAVESGIDVQVVEGRKLSPETGNPRGIRLVSTDASPQRTRVVYMILGPATPDDPNLIPWTWHPGRVLAGLSFDAVPAAEKVAAGKPLTAAETSALGQCAVHLGA
jgi:hypothetical protein